MKHQLKRRRGGPTLAMLADVLQNAWWTRNWMVLLMLIVTVVAAAAAFVGQTVLPWTIYGGL